MLMPRSRRNPCDILMEKEVGYFTPGSWARESLTAKPRAERSARLDAIMAYDQAHTLADILREHHDLAVLKLIAEGELSDTLGKNTKGICLTHSRLLASMAVKCIP